jgi:two-component system, cell cycle sensor histidine kinase and response regulator CckA
MPDTSGTKHSLQELRRQAEKRLKWQVVNEQQLAEMTPNTIRHMMHELQTHQIELEMQNETLRQTQDALVSTRDQFVELYDFSPVGYFTIGERGQITGANLTGCALLSVERSSLLGRSFSDFVFADDQDIFYLHSKEVRADAARKTCELRLKKADTSYFYSRLESQAVVGDASFRVAVSDISASKELEHKLVHLERLNAIGELAAGVSHNLNNMLSGVILPAQMLLDQIDDPLQHDLLEDIIESGRRMTSLVRQVHHSVHQNEPIFTEPLDLNSAIANTLKMSRSRWQDQAEQQGIALDIQTDLQTIPRIQGAKAELESILLNLLLNAVDALPNGGTIALQTRAVEGGAELTLSDTGTGMEPEIQRRIFEPFFTTKKTVGTGLGLSTAHATMQNWQGRISVESAPGVGSKFTLYFPSFSADILETIIEDEPDYHAVTGRLLIVDDSELIISMLSRFLASQHQVEVAHDGVEALDKFAKGRYDLVLLDLGLPKMTGDKVAQAMRQIDPQVALGLITGWTLKADDERLTHFDFYLQKPFGDLNLISHTINRTIALRQQKKVDTPLNPH